MKVAVLGSGGGGCAVAFDFASHGHQVRLFDLESFPDNIAGIREKGGIQSRGDLEGFAPVGYAGHDIDQALQDADLIIAVGPAYSTRPFAEICKPHLQAGQTIVVCPGSCGGAIEFKNTLGIPIRNRELIIAETSTLPYAVRSLEPGRIKVYLKLKGGLFLAALPAVDTARVLSMMSTVYPVMVPARNVLQTSLQNGNPVIHPAITLLNVASIERRGATYNFYQDGVTEAVGRLIEAVDRERIAIGKRLDVDVIPDSELGCLQGYMQEPTYSTGFSEAPGFRGIKAQSKLDHRYFNEDVGYGLVFLKTLGEQFGVETPYMSAVVTLASLLVGRDYIGEAQRTVDSLGLSGYTAQELANLLA